MKQVLIVDTETTALTPADGHCIEVGAILFDLDFKGIICQTSFLLPCIINEAEAVNHIPAELTTLQPALGDPGLAMLIAMINAADALVAHNADFDRQWFTDSPVLPAIPESKPWICTMSDVSWPKELNLKGRPSVASLALAHSIPVWAAHRALTDCIYLAQVLERTPDPKALLTAALEPKLTYRALVSYESRESAKQAGFSWDSQRKIWTKKMTEAEAAQLPFRIEAL